MPYFENCLPHGIRYKTDGSGKVDIAFTKQNEVSYCTIKNNGVGRKKVAAFKRNQHLEYRSKGVDLTANGANIAISVREKDFFIEKFSQ